MASTFELVPAPQLATTLRRLSLARFSFAVVWALLLAFLAPRAPALLTALLVLYPLVDAAAVLVELREAGDSAASQGSARVNVGISALAAVALGWASFVSVPAVVVVWGVWAIASGATQLLTAMRRRRLGGQWPVILSGGLSFVVGFAFVAQGASGTASVTGIAGYATLGGVFFLISAIRLATARRSTPASRRESPAPGTTHG